MDIWLVICIVVKLVCVKYCFNDYDICGIGFLVICFFGKFVFIRIV